MSSRWMCVLFGGYMLGCVSVATADPAPAPETAAQAPATAPEDADGDGIADDLDACRDAPEDVDGELDEDGCPEDDLVLAPDTEVLGAVVSLDVRFRTGKAMLMRRSHAELDAVAVALRLHPATRYEIAVYTDDRGSTRFNEQLSRDRAAAIRDYLVGRGVDGAQLSVMGAGERRPIADNDTPEGREKNRRVELHRLF